MYFLNLSRIVVILDWVNLVGKYCKEVEKFKYLFRVGDEKVKEFFRIIEVNLEIWKIILNI